MSGVGRLTRRRRVIGAVLGMCLTEREATEQAHHTTADCATGDTVWQAVLAHVDSFGSGT